LPMPADLRERGREDPRYFGPDAQFRYERTVEPPDPEEGFSSIESRTVGATPETDDLRRAVMLDFDLLVQRASGMGPVLESRDVAVIPGRHDVLRRYVDDGWLLFAHAWRPQVDAQAISREEIEHVFERTRELVGVALDIAMCTHPAGPPICWCRKPIPGLVLEFAHHRRVSLRRSVVVGTSAADRTMAQRIGAEHRGEDFFSA
jgi:hypothetical protein